VAPPPPGPTEDTPSGGPCPTLLVNVASECDGISDNVMRWTNEQASKPVFLIAGSSMRGDGCRTS
jgi:hypothetical protein